MDISSLDAIPAGFEGCKDDKMEWLHQLSVKIVSRCWRPPDSEQVKIAMAVMDGQGDDPFPYCTCHKGKIFSYFKLYAHMHLLQ